MSDELHIRPVAYYRGPFGTKFGIPRQSALAASVQGRIVFTETYQVQEALRGLDGFERIWLIWGFSANKPAKGEWQPTVRPPRLGGNTAIGVWATRSPFRPNALGLSCVELVAVDGLELVVKGADLMDGTPIYDIKPYIPYADAYPQARSGFVSGAPEARLQVVIPEDLPLDARQREALREVLELDPRPAYQEDSDKVYGMIFEKRDVRFTVKQGILTIREVVE